MVFQEASPGGGLCPHPHDEEEIRECGKACVGSWGEYGWCNGSFETRIYTVHEPEEGGGKFCPHAHDDTQDQACSTTTTTTTTTINCFAQWTEWCAAEGLRSTPWHEDGMDNNGVKWDSWSGAHGVDTPWHGVQDKECVGHVPQSSPTNGPFSGASINGEQWSSPTHHPAPVSTCYNGTQDRE